MFPQLPPFVGWHPLVVHLPIGILSVVPLFLLLALLSRKTRGPLSFSALLLMTVGALGTWLAVASGEAAERVASQSTAVLPVLEKHAELGESVRLIFTLLALIQLIWLGLNWLKRRQGRPLSERTQVLLQAFFMLLYLAALLILVHTGHLGAHLVHEFGLQALVGKLT